MADVSVVDVGGKKLIINMPSDVEIFSSFSVKWTFRFAAARGMPNNIKTFPVGMPEGQIIIQPDPYELLCTPDSVPMCYIIVNTLPSGQKNRRTSGKKKITEYVAICDLDGMGKFCELGWGSATHNAYIASPKSEEFNITDIIGQKEFKKVARQVSNFIVKRKK